MKTQKINCNINNATQKIHLNRYKPYINNLVNKYKSIPFFSVDDIKSWADEAILFAIGKEDFKYCKNKDAFVIGHINTYIKLAIKDSAYFIKYKSKTFAQTDELRNLNKIWSLDYQVSESEDLSLGDVLPSALPDPSTELELYERNEIINKTINELPDEQKELIERHVYENETFQSIADHKGLSKQAVQQRLGAIMKKLRLKFKDII